MIDFDLKTILQLYIQLIVLENLKTSIKVLMKSILKNDTNKYIILIIQ